ncbi:MAG: pyridoxine 5'-phosphate synthase [Bacteroidetes bacterium]|nr:pyridoxine 5'-phosphate synthase [Bacteroidota bacterium]
MTRLSVNINKIATLRNARGSNIPDVIKSAKDIERFGAQGITVHPRQDERHIRKSDVRELKKVITSELNIEGFPSEDFLQLIEEVRPAQATLVPDAPNVLTSNAGWDTFKHQDFLRDIISRIKSYNVRVSLFMAPDVRLIELARSTGTDRIELYTEDFAKRFSSDKENGIAPYIAAAVKASELGMGINAGHDLSLDNLAYFVRHIQGLMEVSIGHALISDALYFGLENTVQMYLREIKKGKQELP